MSAFGSLYEEDNEGIAEHGAPREIGEFEVKREEMKDCSRGFLQGAGRSWAITVITMCNIFWACSPSEFLGTTVHFTFCQMFSDTEIVEVGLETLGMANMTYLTVQSISPNMRRCKFSYMTCIGIPPFLNLAAAAAYLTYGGDPRVRDLKLIDHDCNGACWYCRNEYNSSCWYSPKRSDTEADKSPVPDLTIFECPDLTDPQALSEVTRTLTYKAHKLDLSQPRSINSRNLQWSFRSLRWVDQERSSAIYQNLSSSSS